MNQLYLLAAAFGLVGCIAHPKQPIPDSRPQGPVQPDAFDLSDARLHALGSQAQMFEEGSSNDGPLWYDDGRSLCFVSDRDGVDQIFTVSIENAKASTRALLHSKDRTWPSSVSADGKSLFYRTDNDGDENWSIFKVPLSGGAPTKLTPDSPASRGPPVERGRFLYYSAHSQSEKTMHVEAVPADTVGPPRVVYTDESRASWLRGVSPDGRQGLILHRRSSSDYVLYTADFAGAGTAPLYPPQGKTAAIFSAALSADGHRAFVATDDGGAESYVLSLDVASGAEVARYREAKLPGARLTELQVSPTGNYIAVLVDAGNRGDVRILDERTLSASVNVELPLGHAYAPVAFSPDGKRIALGWSTASAPSSLWAGTIVSGKMSQISVDSGKVVGGSQIESSIQAVQSPDGLSIPVNVYLPSDRATRKLPVLVVLHGGPASSSQIGWNVRTAFWVHSGWAVVEPNVRGSTGFGRAYEQADDGANRLKAVADVGTVGKWIQQQPWADPTRLALQGQSYGGFLVLMALAADREMWKAGVDLYGVYDWSSFFEVTSGSVRESLQKEIGNVSDSAFLQSISPSSHLDSIKRPVFVYAGENDPRVPRSQSDQLVTGLRGRGVEVEYMVGAKEGHSLDRRENEVEFLARSLSFVEKHVR